MHAAIGSRPSAYPHTPSPKVDRPSQPTAALDP
jgi:hypothetical protein